MLQFHSRRLRKRLLSSFLAILLLMTGFFTPTLTAQAAKNVISDNNVQSGVNGSDPSVFSDDLDKTPGNSKEPSEPSSEDFTTDSQNPDQPQADIPSETQSEDVGSDDTTDASEIPEETLDEAQIKGSSFVITFDYNGYLDTDGNSFCQFTAQRNELVGDYIKQVEPKIISPQKVKNWVEYVPSSTVSTDDNSDADLSGELVPTGDTRTINTTKKVINNYTYKAQWGDYIAYSITYELDGGSFTEEADSVAPELYTYDDDDITLPTDVQKEGYFFDGFYTDESFSSDPVTVIKHNSMGDIVLYAKWKSAAPESAPVLKKATNPSTGKVKVTFQKMSDIEGYEFLMSTTQNFKKNTNTLSLDGSDTSVKLTNMPKGKTYYFKMRAYAEDSTGGKAYSPYSNVLSLEITKGVKEYKATSTSAKLNSCTISDEGTLTVSFTASKRIKSSDDSYYLVTLDPNTGKYSSMVAAMPKFVKVIFELPLRDEEGNDLIQGKYALAIKSGSKYQLISAGGFITNPEAAASYTKAFPKSHSKKGLQMPQDSSLISDLNLSHTFINMDLNHVFFGSNMKDYKYNGKTYRFNDAWSPTISALNEMGVTVTGQIMLSYNESTKYMILKSGRKQGKPFYAINVQDKKARETFEAVTSFLAETYSRSDCHLDNWIIGNEVNIHPAWYYAGNISNEAFMKNYASTYRILYYSVKSHSKNSRVYICTDHTWNNRSGDWGAKPFMEAFNKEIKAQQKNIQWNLAYHAYPSILTSAATWNDKLAPNNVDASFVSPKNLSVLTKYMKKTYGSKTRIILSEQGFTSTSGTSVQAAAIAYTYYKAEFDDMIDAVIFRSDIDASGEMSQGLYFGLKDKNGNKKPAYDVFKFMDTTSAEKYTKKYLSTIGIKKWKDIAPKYTLKRFK